jgi:hypothetical protein
MTAPVAPRYNLKPSVVGRRGARRHAGLLFRMRSRPLPPRSCGSANLTFGAATRRADASATGLGQALRLRATSERTVE